MPSKTDFNVSPYFDDFADSKKFHRVMYRPAFAVQARELTTQQSITQNQIEKLGDHMFKHGAMVIPGEISVDFSYQSVKLTSFTGTLDNLQFATVTGGTSGVSAQVVNITATDGTDPDTLFVKYKDSGTDNASHYFVDGETLTSDAVGNETAVVSSRANGSAAHIGAGTYYINGYFVNVDAQVLLLEKYNNQPSYRVGLNVTETFVTSTDDTSLLDNATGASNANATGAHRFKIDLTLAKLALNSTSDSNFVELLRIDNGQINHKVENTTYNILDKTLARRTFDESGDYSVESFDIDVRESVNNGTNNGVYAAGAMTNAGRAAFEDLLAVGMGAGVAYVKGYEVRKLGTHFVDVFKARDFLTDSGIPTRFAQMPFINITNMFGTPDVGFVSDETEVYKKIRLVDTIHTTRGTALTNNDGKIFDIGRAKTRGIEFNSGTADGVFQFADGLTTNTYKHYLFDTVMFAHINVKGAASAALTTGETLTGGSSGATGIVESITSLGEAAITGITNAEPAVVTFSGGHNFTEGQKIKIEDVGGMTELNSFTDGGFYTVKNPTATTLELFARKGLVRLGLPGQAVGEDEIDAVDTTGKSIFFPAGGFGNGAQVYTSGGTAKHTVVVLSEVNGLFVEGETCTGSSSDSTVVVQNDKFGCRGFEQKIFEQTKGVSMVGSPSFTADVDLTKNFGDVKTLTGTISTGTAGSGGSLGTLVMNASNVIGSSARKFFDAGDAIILEDATEATSSIIAIGLEARVEDDVIFGSGTNFNSELRIGDKISFQDDSNNTITRVVESIISDTELETVEGLSNSDATKASLNRQRTKTQFPENDISLFKLPYEVVKTLLTETNAGISDTNLSVRRQFVATLSNSGTATLTAGTNELFSAHSEDDVTVSIMAKGGSATEGAVGDVITLAGSGDFVRGGSPTGKTLSIDLGSTFNGSKIKILTTISTSVAGAKSKTFTIGSTLTVDTAALSAATINLAKADVFDITSVHMSADFNTVATTADTNITDRFRLDTGMRDNFYDIARAVRIPGAAAPTGRLLITFDFFAHGAGNFFSVDSYSGIDYGNIPGYVSDSTGERFELRDCLDFRPRVDDVSTINSGDGQDRQYSGTGASTIDFPKFNSDVTSDVEFYLARKAKMFMMSSGKFELLDGESAINPQEPDTLKDGMHLYDLFLPAYTFRPEDVVIKKVDNRRYTMRDIGRLEQRIESVEYYTQLSLLESEAQNMQIQDADGFDRFKNGIIVDNFTGHGIGDVSDDDYSVSMDMAQGELRPAYHMDNSALKEVSSDLTTAITDDARASQGYQKTGDLITLPYVNISYIDQPYASGTINLNPYDTIDFIGNLVLTPDGDEWFETERRPDFVHHIPGSYDTLTDQASSGVVKLNLGTVWGAWTDSWTGAKQDVNRQINPSTTSGNVKTTTTTITTSQRVGQTRSGIRTSLVPKEVRKSIGDRVIGTSYVPFIRAKSIGFKATGMKPNTRVYAFFDNIDVNDDVTPTNSNEGAALTTNANGEVSGIFSIGQAKPPWWNYPMIAWPPGGCPGLYPGFYPIKQGKRFRTGRRTFRLTSNASNSLTGEIWTSAQTDYVAKGLKNTVQGTIISTREAQFVQTKVAEDTIIKRPGQRTESEEVVIESGGGGGNNGGGHHDPSPPPGPFWTHFPGPGDSTPPYTTDDRVSNSSPTPAKVFYSGKTLGQRVAEYSTFVQPTKEKSVYKAKIRNHHTPEKTQTVTPKTETKTVNSNPRNFARAEKVFAYNPPVQKKAVSNFKSCNGPSWMDPVAQSFLITTAGGAFISSIDLFFQTKSTNMPVDVQLRTMENGYPTREIIPFGNTTVSAADINISADALTPTTFTFPSPVHLQADQEYAFVVLANTSEYKMYTSRMGEKTLDDSRLISKQPYLGSLFKSQNASTWTADQNEDVKFDIKACSFQEDVTGNVTLVNDEVPAHLLLQRNPLTTTNGSADITVNHRNHGMHSTAANVIIAGVPSGTLNGIASTNINGTYTTIKNIKMDSYQITAQNSDVASATGDIGGTDNVSATRNILFDTIHPAIGNVIHVDTTLFATMRTSGGRTLGGSETEYDLDIVSRKKTVAFNSDYYLTEPSLVASQINETNEMNGSKSFAMNIAMNTITGNNNLSPVIDTRTMSIHLVQNRLDNPTSGATPDFVDETTSGGGTTAAKYITKSIILENSSTSLDIRLSANIRASSAVKMYYRATSAEDVRLITDVAWVAFNGTGSPDKSVPPAENNLTFREQQYSDKDIPGFTAFQLKIVLTGTNSSYPPLIKDMRGIALAL